MSTLGDTLAQIDAHNYKEQTKDTFGHLAPEKNKAYAGRLVVAVGCFGSDRLNPTAMIVDFTGLDSSPWFYEAVREFMHKHCTEEGCLYEWNGLFHNYEFTGKFRKIQDYNR